MNKIVRFIATGFYSGLVPFAPGTAGTLAALPLVFLFRFFGPTAYLFLTFLFVVVAIVVAEIYEVAKGSHDSREIVIDEFAGFLITMALVPLTVWSLLLGFLLFRTFDIFKPFPIRYLDKNVSGGYGVVIDDVVAGMFANIILQILMTKIPFFAEAF